MPTRPTNCRAAVVAFAVAAVGCAGGDASPATTESVSPASPIPVVVDTDLAIDDLVALAFLLSSDDVDVLAVTVSGTGEVRCPAGIGVMPRTAGTHRRRGCPGGLWTVDPPGRHP